MLLYVLSAWLIASFALAVLVGRTMRHGLTLADERESVTGARTVPPAPVRQHDADVTA